MIYFTTKDGKQGALDIVMMLRSEGYLPYSVQDGNVLFTEQDTGNKGMFNIGEYAQSEGLTVTKIDGFNSPPTALDIPPNGMNNLDQSVFYMGGGRVDALKQMFPQATELSDGRVVVLDRDGLWKTMWSDTWTPPQPFPNYDTLVNRGVGVDTKAGLKGAGIAFLFALSGVEAKIVNGDVTPESVCKMFKAIDDNSPLETKMQLGKIANQTTGLDDWKFNAGLLEATELCYWLKEVTKMTSLEFRMKQIMVGEVVIKALQKLANDEFMTNMNALAKNDITSGMLINMKQVVDEFLMMMDQLSIIRDMSRVTGLEEWKAMAADVTVDQLKMPPMPAFVPKLVKLLHYLVPISDNKSLYMARGNSGLNAITSLMVMIDNCLYSLADVPDSTAKQKMFMALKNLQTKIESKLAFFFHPIDNPKGMKSNLFMEAKARYTQKRETMYKIIQSPKETWNSILMETVKKEPNLEAFYEVLPKGFADLMKSFVAMDIAYDMQPWVDTRYQERINDPVAMTNDSFGPPPPEYGYLAENSPRAALNIIETLIEASGYIQGLATEERRHMLRSPLLFANLMKIIQTASVRREVGTVEALSKMGIGGLNTKDPYTSIDPYRIWDDQQQVQQDKADQMDMMMQQLKQQQMMQQQNQIDQASQAQGAQDMAAQGGDGQQQGGPPSGPAPASSRGNGMPPNSGGASDQQPDSNIAGPGKAANAMPSQMRKAGGGRP